MTCQYASSGCNDPEGECLGVCMKYQHNVAPASETQCHPAIKTIAETHQSASNESAVPDGEELERIIDNYLDGYELRGDGGDHTPNEFESLLIKDAILGLLVDEAWDKAWGELIRSEAATIAKGLGALK